MSIKFLAELFRRYDFPPESAIATGDFSRQNNIVFFETAKPSNYLTNYFAVWGGTYDDVLGTTSIQLIMKQFLQQVSTSALLIARENSFYIDGTKVYMNLPLKPWQYEKTETETEIMVGFSSAPRDPDNPSDTKYSGANYPCRLAIPSVKSKLSDPVSGTVLSPPWSISLANDDGYYDDTDENNFFNVPIRLLKSTDDLPDREDFAIVRAGYVDDQKTDERDFVVDAVDILRSLDEEACDLFTTTEFATAPDNTIGKKKPLVYGSRTGLPLFVVNSGGTQFYAGDYVSAVSEVYDADGGTLSFTFASATGIITEATGKAKYADVTGSADNMIGEMIVDKMAEKSTITYDASFWDMDESAIYVNDSPDMDFYFTGGTVKKFVEELLKNDNAFLIQKNNGKLTLRKWGESYATHTISNTMITQKPKKNFTEAKEKYMTSMSIDYAQDLRLKEYEKNYIYDTTEAAIVEEYRKTKPADMTVQLADDADVQTLAAGLVARFGKLPETVDVGVGYNTAEIELLDFVQLPMVTNGRRFSKMIGWIVKAVDPGQDKLTLEQNTFYDKEFQTGIASFNEQTTTAKFPDAAFENAARVTGTVRVTQ